MTHSRSLLAIFLSFFKTGLFTLGGGYAMLPLIEREVVEKKGWITSKDFLDGLAVAQSLPGPVAVNTSVYTGYKTRGVAGAVTALLGAVLPSFIIMILIAAFFTGARNNKHVVAIFTGLRPAVAALIAASVWSLARKAKLTVRTLPLMLAAALAVWLLRISPAWLALAVAVIGAFLPRRPDQPKTLEDPLPDER